MSHKGERTFLGRKKINIKVIYFFLLWSRRAGEERERFFIPDYLCKSFKLWWNPCWILLLTYHQRKTHTISNKLRNLRRVLVSALHSLSSPAKTGEISLLNFLGLDVVCGGLCGESVLWKQTKQCQLMKEEDSSSVVDLLR